MSEHSQDDILKRVANLLCQPAEVVVGQISSPVTFQGLQRVRAEMAALSLHSEMVEALKMAQATLAMLTEPNAIRSSRVQEAWASAVAAELKCRSALSQASQTTGGENE